MPELPEVETLRRQLAPLVEKRTLERMEILDPRWSSPLEPGELADALTGRRVECLLRRGKYLAWVFEGEIFLVQHLRMSGVLLHDPIADPPHTRVRMQFAGGGGGRPSRSHLVVSDMRRFGTGELVIGERALEEFFAKRLGLEPFDPRFTAAYLRARLRGRTAPIKAALLDQQAVAGVGNIYADEALFRARIHASRPAGRLTSSQYEDLRTGLIDALSAGIDARGASIDAFRDVDGVRGSFQDRFLVHRRAGEPCPRCGTPIVKRVVAGRGTYACEHCQPPPRARRRRPQTPAASTS
jgi:formamidopyrimidine-DNA glycosylase